MQPFRIAIAGLGTVGAETARILLTDDSDAERPCRACHCVEAVSARDRGPERGVDLTGIDWVDDAASLAGRDDIDCVLELIGGSEGVAYDLGVERTKIRQVGRNRKQGADRAPRN